jgi:hypothetical protein
MVAISFTTLSGHCCGGAGGAVVVVGLGAAENTEEPGPGGGSGAPEGSGDDAASEELALDELDASAGSRRPTEGGLLDGRDVMVTPADCWLAALLTESSLALDSSAPAAQISTSTASAEPMVATARRRRYTEGGRGPRGSSTSGN